MRIFVGLGANLDSPRDHLRRAIQRLVGVGGETWSSLYLTDPQGLTDQPRFLNLVVRMEWSTGPRELLHFGQELEHEAGRQPGPRWGPRTLDVDLLWADGQSCDDPDLILPHPRLLEREFALRPLLEIWPAIWRPDDRRILSRQLRQLPPQGVVCLGDFPLE